MYSIKEKFHVYLLSAYHENKRVELFEYIWNHYHRKISCYIANLIPYSHPAFEDIFQEVMLKIYKHLSDFNPARSFKGWIYQIVRNHCLDFIKNKQESMFASKIEMGEYVSASDNPEKITLDREIRARIDFFLQSLSPRDREIAYLRFYENLRYKEIGRIVDMNPNTLRAKVHLWKNELSEELKEFR